MRASKTMQNRVMATPNIEVLWNTETVDLEGDDKGLTGVRVKNNKTGEEHSIAATGFFVAIGHTPNTDIFKGQIDMDETGYIKTKADSTGTNLPGVFCSGDAQDKVFRQAITAAGTGCMAALESERYLGALGH
jgi:thioredoxin reductase (NADPH)